MLTLEEFKKLLGDEKISDAEAEKIRGACYACAELALEILKSKGRKNNFVAPVGFGQKDSTSLPKTDKSNGRCYEGSNKSI